MPYNPSNYTRCEKCKHIDRENEKCKITNDNWLVSDRADTCHQFEGIESMENKKGFKKGDLIKITNKEIADFLNVNLKNEFRVLEVEAFNVKVFANYPLGFVWINNRDIEKVESENEKLEENPHEKLAKEFEEQMGKVGELAKCNMYGIDVKKGSNVNHPSHYNKGIEAIKYIESWDMNFNIGNVIKYVSRAKYKGKELEDLQKAAWYLAKEIERVKANA